MGQRLNIEIVNNERVLANSYYHWSAYTSSSIGLTKHILENFEKIKDLPPLKTAISLLQFTGAGFNESEMKAALNILELADFKINETTGRNDGLISASEKGIKETEQWEECRVTINIESKSINFNVFSESTKEEYFEDYEVEKDTVIEDLPFDIANIKFDEFDNFSKIFEDNEGVVFFVKETNKIIIPIE